MIEKVLEAFFRHVALIVLPIVVVPFVVTAAVLSTPAQYEAQAGMWVEQATYLNYSNDALNPYLSPAQNQRNRLVELLQTRSFVAEIAKKTVLAPLTLAPGGEDALRQLFARDFDAATSGDHLLVLRFRAEDRELAMDALNKVIASFKSRTATDRYGQAQVAINFYQTRLTRAASELVAAKEGYRKYLAENAAVATTLNTRGYDAARLVDLRFGEVARRLEAAQRDADAAQSSLDRATLDVSAGVEGMEFGFRVMDPVIAPPTPSRQLRKVLVYPLVALLTGLVLSATLLLLLALSDRSVRSLADLGPDTVILGVLPPLRARGIARGAGPGVTRRAVGFVAGATLPLRGGAESRS